MSHTNQQVHNTTPGTLDADIPVIDFSRLRRAETARALDQACREWGFFYIVKHGIDPMILERVRAAMHQFFGQPLSVKRRVERTEHNPWGFFDRELTKNTPDWKQVYDYGPGDGDQMTPQWPAGLPGFRSAVRSCYAACEQVGLELLGAMSANLGMSSRYLHGYFSPHNTSFLRMNYYPRCDQPARPEGLNTPECGHLGVNHHTDAGALTILAQDNQPGLEVFRQGRWHLVAPRADTLVVNLGDLVQVWSNDRYTAAMHRVITNPRAERYSAPFFLNPAYGTECQPLPSLCDRQGSPRYRAVHWGEYRAARSAGDYADLGEEIQIAQFRTQED